MTTNEDIPAEIRGVSTFIVKTLVNLLVSLPFIGFAIYGLIIAPADIPIYASLVCGGIGGFLLITGFFLGFLASFPMPMLVQGEKELIMRHPTMRPAYVRMLISIPFFAGAGYLFFVTLSPYVYPFVVGLIGFWMFFKGTTRYLRNLCITYLVTDRRIIHMYKFLWLYTNEIPVGRIISIQEARGLFEILTGRGSVVVSSGIGARMTIRMEEIDDPGPVANQLRGLLPE
jgi:hypothetical protein